jgi:HSP20 family protein
MDEEMQNYFERLAHGGVNLDENTHIELAKSSSAPIKVHREEPAELKLEDESSEDISSEVEGQLTIDVYQTPDEIVIESTIAGVKPEDLDINITSETVTIRGERKRDKKISDEDYFYQECYWGKFSRSIILPQEIDPEKSTATLKNGILTIRLPKLNRHKGRSLKIKFE